MNNYPIMKNRDHMSSPSLIERITGFFSVLFKRNQPTKSESVKQDNFSIDPSKYYPPIDGRWESEKRSHYPPPPPDYRRINW